MRIVDANVLLYAVNSASEHHSASGAGSTVTKVPFTAPEHVIGKTTTSALESGLVYGFAGQVDAIVVRIRDELGAPDVLAIAMGGLAGAHRAAFADDHGDRSGADTAGAPARLGEEPARDGLDADGNELRHW